VVARPEPTVLDDGGLNGHVTAESLWRQRLAKGLAKRKASACRQRSPGRVIGKRAAGRLQYTILRALPAPSGTTRDVLAMTVCRATGSPTVVAAT
jgi:hypothetical protein